MSGSRLTRPTRRELLFAGIAGTGALAVGAYGGFKLGKRAERGRRVTPPREQVFAPNAFVAIDDDGNVTIWLAQTEVGQGVATSLPMLVADELGADPSRIRLQLAPANEAYGGQFTAVSSSTKSNWLQLRQAGAAAREMLLQAAATGFGVEPEECIARNGFVLHQESGRRLPFSALVAAASALPVPTTPQLKDPADFEFIGKKMPRLDHPVKVDGSAKFGIDVRLPGMRFAVIARCPTIGGKVASFNDQQARKVPGVIDVFRIDSGIAVVADTTHAAIRGRSELQLTYEHGSNSDYSSDQVVEDMQRLAQQPGDIAQSSGAGRDGLTGEGTRITAEYQFPYLAHATMEVMNCTADVRPESCVIHVPTQVPQSVRDEAAGMLDLPKSSVEVNVTWVGGAFGRRVAQDFVREAVLTSKHAGCPVQVFWTREDDFAHDHYRPCSLHRLEALINADGQPTAWHHRIVAQSILAQDPNFTDPIDPTAVEGAIDIPYEIPNIEVELVKVPAPFQLGFWRSVGHSFNALAVECFLDEIANACGQSPIAMRRALLTGPTGERQLRVLDAAIKHAGQAPSSAGTGRGVAVHASFGSLVAMVADVETATKPWRVVKITAAVDCGYAIHPDGVAAQIEGSVVFAMSALLYGGMQFDQGAATPSNFHNQRLLRMHQAPQVAVHLMPGDASMATLGGVGEIGVPPVAPAILNALFAATGKRLRQLPISMS